MEVTKRLHPLLTIAAISITVFSAVGVAALTGVLPHSVGSSKEAAPALVAAPDIAASIAVSSAVEKPADEVAPMPPAAPASTPKPHKKAARAKAPTKPVQIAEAAPQAQAAPVPPPPPAPIEAPKPLPGILGVVESVREVKTPADKSNGSGPIVGGLAGAVLGNQFGKGMTRNVLTVVGAAGGALAGREVEREVRATKRWEVNVRLDDGSTRTLNSDAQPYWHGGERVRLVDGKLQPA